MYYTDVIDAFLMPTFEAKRDNELSKANQMLEQLNSSIEWLDFEISKQTNYQEKANLQKEKTAAEWERERLVKEIYKVK